MDINKVKIKIVELINVIKERIKKYHITIEIPFNSKTEKLVIVVKKGVSPSYCEQLAILIQKSINSSILILPGDFIRKIKKIKRCV